MKNASEFICTVEHFQEILLDIFMCKDHFGEYMFSYIQFSL